MVSNSSNWIFKRHKYGTYFEKSFNKSAENLSSENVENSLITIARNVLSLKIDNEYILKLLRK